MKTAVFEKAWPRRKEFLETRIRKMHDNAHEGQKKKLIVDYLTAYCFGDFYTRNGARSPRCGKLVVNYRDQCPWRRLQIPGQIPCKGQYQGWQHQTKNLVDALAIMPLRAFAH